MKTPRAITMIANQTRIARTLIAALLALTVAALPAHLAPAQEKTPASIPPAARVELEHPDWDPDLEHALQGAQRQGRPLLVFFGSGSNPPSAAMLRETLSDNRVRLALRSVARAIVDVDASPELAGKHDVTSLPSFIVLDNDGKEYDRFTGFIAPNAFIQTFRAAVDPNQTIPGLERRVRKNPEDLEALWLLARKYARDRNAKALYPQIAAIRKIDPDNRRGYLDNAAYLEFMTSLNPRIADDALRASEDFLEEYPRSEFADEVTLTQAHLAYMTGDKDRCLSILDDFPNRYPGSPLADEVRKNFRRIRAEVEKENQDKD